MMAWVFYDITEDSTRNKVASLCLDYGLMRVQKSVFCGEISQKTLSELSGRIRKTVEGTGGEESVMFLPVCENCIAGVISVGKPFSPEKFRYPRLIIIG